MHRLGCALALRVGGIVPALCGGALAMLLWAGCSIGRDCPGADCIELPPLPDGGLPDATVTTRDAACAVQSARAMRASTRPLDIVFVIDNSGSMTEEIAAIRRNINQNFAALIQESGADYRVVVISRFGTDGTAVCIEPPLAGAECSAGLYENDSPVFFHYNAEIGSNDALCLILSTFDRPDPELRAPQGWQTFLRPEALKAFIVITDDSPGCMYEDGELSVQFGGLEIDPYAEALAFHQALLQKAPEQFGVPPDVRYLFYSFVGMRPNEPETEPWFPHQEVQPTTCDTAAGPGVTYQALSIITDALRYPVCEGRGFDAVFRVLAHSVVEAVKADCVFDFPDPPEGQSIMRSTIAIEYRPGGVGEPLQLSQVQDAAECSARSFLVRDDRLELCPEACTAVEADSDARLDVLYSCLVVPQ